jgi:hypothetical protein
MCLKIQYEKWPGSLRTAKKQLELQRIVAQKNKILERNWRSIRHDCKARKDAKSLQKPDSKKESAFSSNWRKLRWSWRFNRPGNMPEKACCRARLAGLSFFVQQRVKSATFLEFHNLLRKEVQRTSKRISKESRHRRSSACRRVLAGCWSEPILQLLLRYTVRFLCTFFFNKKRSSEILEIQSHGGPQNHVRQ